MADRHGSDSGMAWIGCVALRGSAAVVHALLFSPPGRAPTVTDARDERGPLVRLARSCSDAGAMNCPGDELRASGNTASQGCLGTVDLTCCSGGECAKDSPRHERKCR